MVRNVVVVDRAVRSRVRPQPDRLAGGDLVQVRHGKPAAGPVRGVHARDHHGQAVQACTEPGGALLGDLGDPIGRGGGVDRVPQRIGFGVPVPRVRVRPVDPGRGHHQRRRRPAEVREHQARADRVDVQCLTEIITAAKVRG